MSKIEKQSIRKTALELRNSLNLYDVKQKSSIIMQKLSSLREFKFSYIVMTYINISNEVDTKHFINKCFELKKRVAIPKIMNYEMFACEIYNSINIKQTNSGIYEPLKIKKINSSKIDFIVVPGVGFDLNKNRIGYGKGYYDKFLKNARYDCLKVGVAFEIQIFDKIPKEQHDMPLDFIVTENRII